MRGGFGERRDGCGDGSGRRKVEAVDANFGGRGRNLRSRGRMTDEYVESEKARIDALIEELQDERRRIIKEGEETGRPEMSDSVTDRIVRAGMGCFIHALLGGRGTYRLRSGALPWGTSASFELHGLMDLDHDTLYALAQVEFGADMPEDGEPAIVVEIRSCNEHLDCMYAEVDVIFSENDWKELNREPVEVTP